MEIGLIGSTNNIKTKEEALEFGAKMGRVCYSEEGFNDGTSESNQRVLERLLNSGHHSPFDHIQFNFEFKNIPKFGAMILNNQRPYVTSEKSARYKKMKLTEEEQVLYSKWMGIFQQEIEEKYPFLTEQKVTKLAQENARYLTSVFTPTHMAHTISFRQLNYFVHWFEDFMFAAPWSEFNDKTKEFMIKFNKTFIDESNLYEKRLNPKIKNLSLGIFSDRDFFPVEFGEDYSVVYKGTFAQLAQAHRHRLIDYEIVNLESSLKNPEPFVPLILSSNRLVNEWENDFYSLAKNFPQGTLINIHETGNYKDFITKATERLCEHAQWEIMNQTHCTLQNYVESTSNSYVRDTLLPYTKGPKCTFPNIKCQEPGPFGKKLALERRV
jgi:thymidylate synthase ThyX